MRKKDKRKLTKKTVDSVYAEGKDVYVWDTEVIGFGLRVKPSGVKSYFIRYRNKHGRSRSHTLGKHGQLTPDKARGLAKIKMGKVAEGHDPSEEKILNLQIISVNELCDLYLKEGCKHKKTSSIESDTSLIKHHIKPLLGTKSIAAVRRADVERMKNSIVEGKTAKKEKGRKHGRIIVRGGKGAASRAVTLLSTLFTFAMNRDLVEYNPCRGVKKFSGKKCERFLSETEFKELGEAIKSCENEEHPSAIGMIRMLIFTGCRKSEIMTLKWEYIDWEASCIHLPDSKTGAKTVKLGQPALEILKTQITLKNNPYVFYGEKAGHHFVGLQKVWNKIKEKKPSLHDLRLHDLRHSFASVGVNSGHSLLLVGKLLGHSNTATTARYAHLSDDPVKATVDDITAQIQEAMG